jgi:glycosyltransferase involved in cell wall biosynthesis
MNRVYPPGRGATGRVLCDLARSFAREGWHVTVITTGPAPLKERDGTIRIIRVKGPAKPSGVFTYGWLWLKMIATALRQPASHLLVTMTDPPLLVIAGQIIKRFKKCRHIHWCHDLYPELLPAIGVKVPGPVMGVFKRIAHRAMKRADKTIVIGRCMARQLTFSGMDPKNITVIPNWPDAELVVPQGTNGFNGASHEINGVNGHHRNGRAYEEQLNGGHKFRVLYAGTIGQAHPIKTILEAAEILNVEQPDVEFLFVGDGARYDMLAKERSKRHLDNIRLLPFQPRARLKELMESGDVHLISMTEDAAGLLVPSKLYSALAANRPCIFVGPPHSEAAKVITDFKAGVIVGQGQAEELVRWVKHYRSNSEAWFEAQKGAVSASEIFLPNESINAWIERAWGVVKSDLSVGRGR